MATLNQENNGCRKYAVCLLTPALSLPFPAAAAFEYLQLTSKLRAASERR